MLQGRATVGAFFEVSRLMPQSPLFAVSIERLTNHAVAAAAAADGTARDGNISKKGSCIERSRWATKGRTGRDGRKGIRVIRALNRHMRAGERESKSKRWDDDAALNASDKLNSPNA